MRRRTVMKLAGLPFLINLPLQAQQNRTLHISTLLLSDPATIIAAKEVVEAYRRLNLNVEIKELPGDRSLQSANLGETDGELYRRAELEAQYSNLIMVPVPLMNYEIVVFSHKVNFPVKDWESLRPYNVGFVKSIKAIEDNTRGMKIEVAPALRNAFLKMMVGRSDVVVCNRLSGLGMIKELGLTDVKLLSPALSIFPVYHYIHKKHAELLVKLTRELRQMQEDKTFENMQKTVIANLGLE